MYEIVLFYLLISMLYCVGFVTDLNCVRVVWNRAQGLQRVLQTSWKLHLEFFSVINIVYDCALS